MFHSCFCYYHWYLDTLQVLFSYRKSNIDFCAAFVWYIDPIGSLDIQLGTWPEIKDNMAAKHAHWVQHAFTKQDAR